MSLAPAKNGKIWTPAPASSHVTQPVAKTNTRAISYTLIATFMISLASTVYVLIKGVQYWAIPTTYTQTSDTFTVHAPEGGVPMWVAVIVFAVTASSAIFALYFSIKLAIETAPVNKIPSIILHSFELTFATLIVNATVVGVIGSLLLVPSMGGTVEAKDWVQDKLGSDVILEDALDFNSRENRVIATTGEGEIWVLKTKLNESAGTSTVTIMSQPSGAE